MITLDDVCRIKAVLIAHGEWLGEDTERARVTVDGVFEWTTTSCCGEAIAALINDGFDVFIWPSVQLMGFIKIEIS